MLKMAPSLSPTQIKNFWRVSPTGGAANALEISSGQDEMSERAESHRAMSTVFQPSY